MQHLPFVPNIENNIWSKSTTLNLSISFLIRPLDFNWIHKFKIKTSGFQGFYFELLMQINVVSC